MGTNYYLHGNVCESCGRGDEPLHIGKSSCGWHFALHVIPEENIKDLEDWSKRWCEDDVVIRNEYGDVIEPIDMLDIISQRKWNGKKERLDEWYKDNHAEEGLNGLARHKIELGHCVGHGDGTWDLIESEFC